MAEDLTAKDPEAVAASSSWTLRHMPLVVTLAYLCLGALWILFSDRTIERNFPSLEQVLRLQTYKGLIYVLLSGVLIYVLLKRYHRRTERSLQAAARLTAALKDSENEVRQNNAALELRVEQRTRQLEAANRELEAFVHAVSHDLRAPLRAMAGFSHALKELAPQGLDAQAHHYLKRIQEASQRMSMLIDDLLSLSRISQSELTPREIDFTALVREVAAELGERYPGRKVDFEVAPGMTTQGDPRLLRIAMENLLDNAWKYTGDRDNAHIRVSCESAGDERRFTLSDNGVGFDMAYADKIFGPFQRLHADSQFPGTGIGLVTVERILARHGGRIWAHAEVGKGATFTFVLPVHASITPRCPEGRTA